MAGYETESRMVVAKIGCCMSRFPRKEPTELSREMKALQEHNDSAHDPAQTVAGGTGSSWAGREGWQSNGGESRGVAIQWRRG